MPLISIIIPTRNRASMLAEAVQSAWRAGSDVEVIVVDDASSDNTPEVCARLPGIVYERLEQHSGAGAARNVGVLKSAAKFVAFLDDDDLRLPNSLESQIVVLENDPAAAFCYGKILFADTSQRHPTRESYPPRCPTGDVFWELLEWNFIPLQSVVARRESLLDCKLFDSTLPRMSDWDMWLRLAETNQVVAVEAAVALYRRPAADSGQISSNSVNRQQHVLDIQNRGLNLPRARAAGARRRRLRRRLIDVSYQELVHEAAIDLSAGDREMGQAKIREAIRVRPVRSLINQRLMLLLLSRVIAAPR